MAHHIDIRALRNFLVVATTGSISQAAEICYISQPALSSQMKNLEEYLEVELLERTHKGVVLTSAGEIFLAHAKTLTADLQTAVNAVRGIELIPQGTVSIGMPLSIARLISAPLLKIIMQQYPRINLKILEMGSAYVPEMISKGDIDLGITFKNDQRKGIHYQKIMREKLGLLVSRQLIKNDGQDIDIIKNNPHLPFVVPPSNHGLRDAINLLMDKHQIELNIIAEVNTISLLINLSLKGLAATILSYPSIQDYTDSDQVLALEFNDEDIRRNVFLCYSEIRAETLAIKTLMNAMLGLTAQLDAAVI